MIEPSPVPPRTAAATGRQFDLQDAFPLLYVLKRVTSPGAHWASPARWIAVVIADCMDSKTNSGFMSISTIAERAHVNERTVQRHLPALCEGPGRLFDRELGRDRACYTFTLIRDEARVPVAASKRGANEARQKKSHTKPARTSLDKCRGSKGASPKLLALQQQLLRSEIDEAEYSRRLAALVKSGGNDTACPRPGGHDD